MSEKIKPAKRNAMPTASNKVSERLVTPFSTAIAITPIYEQAHFSESGRAHVQPECYLERRLGPDQWVTSRAFGRNLPLETARNVASALPGYRVVVHDGNGNYYPDIGSEIPDEHLREKPKEVTLSFACPECQLQLQNNLREIILHFAKIHDRTITPGEANRIVKASNSLEIIPYNDSDQEGKIAGEVGGGGMFTNRRKY